MPCLTQRSISVQTGLINCRWQTSESDWCLFP